MVEIVAVVEFDRLDTTGTRLDVEVRGGGLAPARLRVPDDDRMLRWIGGRQLHVNPERLPGRDRCKHEDDGEQHDLQQDPADRDGDDGAREQQHCDDPQDGSSDAPPADRLPAGDARQQQQHGSDQSHEESCGGALITTMPATTNSDECGDRCHPT